MSFEVYTTYENKLTVLWKAIVVFVQIVVLSIACAYVVDNADLITTYWMLGWSIITCIIITLNLYGVWKEYWINLVMLLINLLILMIYAVFIYIYWNHKNYSKQTDVSILYIIGACAKILQIVIPDIIQYMEQNNQKTINYYNDNDVDDFI